MMQRWADGDPGRTASAAQIAALLRDEQNLRDDGELADEQRAALDSILAIAADSTRFGTPGVNIGLFCSTPMVAVSRAIPRKQVMEMLLTGEMIDAETAVAHGLINRAVPETGLEDAVQEMAGKIASKSPLVLKTGKKAFYRQLEMPLADAYAYTSQVMVDNMQARDAAEGIDAFIEKRAPEWKGE